MLFVSFWNFSASLCFEVMEAKLFAVKHIEVLVTEEELYQLVRQRLVFLNYPHPSDPL